MPLPSEAASRLRVSKSAFLCDAAAQAGSRVVARADVTTMVPEIFDSLMASLETPGESPGLEALAAVPRLTRR